MLGALAADVTFYCVLIILAGLVAMMSLCVTGTGTGTGQVQVQVEVQVQVQVQ